MLLRNVQTGLEQKFAQITGPRSPLFSTLRWLNRALTRRRPHLAISRRLLRPVHRGFGGSLKAFFAGGAFTDPKMLRFFYDLGIQVANGYGLTEAGTVVTLNDFEDYRPETVGRPLPHAEVRVAPDGEVLVRGPRMLGYLGEAACSDEWLPTGDLGHLDDGFLVLHGRSKHQFVTAYGRNVNPEWVEAELVQQSLVDHRPQPRALGVSREETAAHQRSALGPACAPCWCAAAQHVWDWIHNSLNKRRFLSGTGNANSQWRFATRHLLGDHDHA